jgi:hypothetical protein
LPLIRLRCGSSLSRSRRKNQHERCETTSQAVSLLTRGAASGQPPPCTPLRLSAKELRKQREPRVPLRTGVARVNRHAV